MVKRIVWIIVFLVTFGIGIFVFSLNKHEKRLNVVLATSPVAIFSYEKSWGARLILLPENLVIEGLQGYGNYSLEGLWKLGIIDKKKGELLRLSLEEAIALPINYYLGEKDKLLSFSNQDIAKSLKQFFKLSQISNFAGGKWQTNMSFTAYFGLINLIESIPDEEIKVFDFQKNTVSNDEFLPDGTSRQILDTNKFDHAIDTFFEEEEVRQAGLTVAIYNTTHTPLLGNRAARLLSHLGARVVSVANDSPQIDQCEVVIQKEYAKNEFAEFIIRHYACKLLNSGEPGRANMVLRLGRDYEARFKKVD